MCNYWDRLIDLWTVGEGCSDLILRARVTDWESNYIFDIGMVYVPKYYSSIIYGIMVRLSKDRSHLIDQTYYLYLEEKCNGYVLSTA